MRGIQAFVENRGQWDSRAKFQLRSGGKTLWLSNNGIVFENSRPQPQDAAPDLLGEFDLLNHGNLFEGEPSRSTPFADGLSPTGVPKPSAFERLVFSEQFIGANENPGLEPLNPQPGHYNYLVESDPTKWQTNIRSYSGVIYRNVWDGVDFKVVRHGADVEQEFVVHAGADPNKIQVAYSGVDKLDVASDGSLLIETEFGELHESKPVLYQEIGGKRVPVEGRFRLADATTYTFEVNSYQPNYALVVDPTLLYSTYLGGSNEDYANGIAVDNAGNAYVTGQTNSSDFPTTSGALQTSTNGAPSAFVTKFNALGQLAYSTFLGQFSGIGYGIAVDSAGEAYVTGITGQSTVPTTQNAYQACSAAGNYFFSKLDAAGDGLMYSTCYGTPGSFHPSYVALDSSGRAYIAGGVDASGPIPTTAGAYQQAFAGGSGNDAFFMIIDPGQSGSSSLVYSTYLGGTNDDVPNAVAVDAFGAAYITGYTRSPDFPVTAGAFQTGIPSSQTAFIAKVNPFASGSASLTYATFVGGNVNSIGTGIAVDASDSAYITGYALTVTGNTFPFPVTPGAFQGQPPLGGYTNGSVAFVTKLNAAGNGLVYSSLLYGLQGSSVNSYGTSIALNQLGEAYVTGYTRTTDFPVTVDAFQQYPGGGGALGYNAFLTKFNATGTGVIYSSYLGGANNDDIAQGVTVDASGDAYVAGYTYSPDFPTVNPYQPVLDTQGSCSDPFRGNCADAFIAKFPIGSSQTFSILAMTPAYGGNVGTVHARIVGSGFHNGATVQLVGPNTLGGSSIVVGTGGQTIEVIFDLASAPPGSYNVVVTNPGGGTISLSGGFTVQQGGGPQLAVNIIGPAAVDIGHGPTILSVIVQNQGNTDGNGVIVSLYGIPSDAILEPLFTIAPTPALPGQQPIDFSQTPFAPIVGQQQIPTLVIPSLPPGLSVALPFSLVITSLPAPAPLQPPPPLLGGQIGTSMSSGPAIGVTAVVALLDKFCSLDLGCLGDILATVFPSVSGIPCAQSLICPFVDGSLLPSQTGPQWLTVLNFTQLLGQAFLNAFKQCGSFVLTSSLTGFLNLVATAIAFMLDCPNPLNFLGESLALLIINASIDPNDKEGIGGVGLARWTGGAQRLSYGVYFLNEPTATAAAQNVVVTDALDRNIDISTLSVDAITINGLRIPVSPSLSALLGQYQSTATVDFRPAQSLLVNVNVALNPATSVLSLQLSSVDPTTGLPPADPNVGVLPPGIEGSILYSAMPKPSLATGTQISNQAAIVFDINPSTNTPSWMNTLDNTPPVSRVAALPTTEGSTTFPVQWSGTDVGSGIQGFTLYVSDDGGPFTIWQQNTTSTSGTFTGQVGHVYGFVSQATDLVGNVETLRATPDAITTVTGITSTATTTTLTSPGAITYGQSVTFTAAVAGAGGTPTGSISFSDAANSLGTVPLVNGTASLSAPNLIAGSHSITAVYSGDTTFAASSANIPQMVNQAASTAIVSSSLNPAVFGQTINLTATVVPQFGGIATGTVSFFDGASQLGTAVLSGNAASLSGVSLPAGPHTITASYVGDSNVHRSTSTPQGQTVNQASTTALLGSSVNPSSLNQTVTFTANVTSQYGGPLTGSITFKNGNNTLASVPLANGQAVFSTRFTNIEINTITAAYSGDNNNAPSISAALKQIVNPLPAASATVVTTSGSPSFIHQSVTFTSTTTSNYGPIPDGETVTFYNGVNVIGTSTTLGGVATLSTTALSVGSHTIKAVYAGDATFKSSSGATTQVVSLYSSTTSVTSNPNSSIYGQPVGLIANVISNAPGGPIGTVTFKNGSTILGEVALNAGTALLSVTKLPAGSLTITGTYNGDNQSARSTGSTGQTVGQATSTVLLSSSPNTSSAGQVVEFRATVISPTTTPEGVVSFVDGSTTLATVNLVGGKANYSTSALGIGSHNVTAVYGGTTNVMGSTSPLVVQSVH